MVKTRVTIKGRHIALEDVVNVHANNARLGQSLPWNTLTETDETQTLRQFLIKRNADIDYLNQNVVPLISKNEREVKFAGRCLPKSTGREIRQGICGLFQSLIAHMGVMPAHLLAVMSNEFHDNSIGDSRLLQHRDGCVTEAVERNPRTVPACASPFLGFLMTDRFPKSSIGQDVAELVAEGGGFETRLFQGFQGARVKRG